MKSKIVLILTFSFLITSAFSQQSFFMNRYYKSDVLFAADSVLKYTDFYLLTLYNESPQENYEIFFQQFLTAWQHEYNPKDIIVPMSEHFLFIEELFGVVNDLNVFEDFFYLADTCSSCNYTNTDLYLNTESIAFKYYLKYFSNNERIKTLLNKIGILKIFVNTYLPEIALMRTDLDFSCPQDRFFSIYMLMAVYGCNLETYNSN